VAEEALAAQRVSLHLDKLRQLPVVDLAGKKRRGAVGRECDAVALLSDEDGEELKAQEGDELGLVQRDVGVQVGEFVLEGLFECGHQGVVLCIGVHQHEPVEPRAGLGQAADRHGV